MTSEQTESFLSRAPRALVPVLRAHGGLEEALAGLVRQAREAWPEVGMDAGAFLGHVAERLPATGEPGELLASLRAGELFLAFACTRGDAWRWRRSMRTCSRRWGRGCRASRPPWWTSCGRY